MVHYSGSWNSIRETVVCNLKDKDGKKHEIRLLVDTGATVSTLPFYTLYRTRGNWDVGNIPPINLHGINSVSSCDMMCKATLSPGNHLKANFRNEVGIADNFEIEVDFLIMRGVKTFTVLKRELPEALRTTLASSSYHLADPEQINLRDQILYIHGILGVRAIHKMDRKGYEKIAGSEMTLCRSKLGDLLFGASHFLPRKVGNTPIPLNDNGDFEEPIDSITSLRACSEHVVNSGVEEHPEEEPKAKSEKDYSLSVRELEQIEERLEGLQE